MTSVLTSLVRVYSAEVQLKTPKESGEVPPSRLSTLLLFSPVRKISSIHHPSVIRPLSIHQITVCRLCPIRASALSPRLKLQRCGIFIRCTKKRTSGVVRRSPGSRQEPGWILPGSHGLPWPVWNLLSSIIWHCSFSQPFRSPR